MTQRWRGGGQNLRVAGGAPGVRVWLFPENLRETCKEAGGTETRRIFGVQAYSLSDTPHAGEDGRVNRIKAAQQALDGRVKRVYLEIGVSHGGAFRRISADEKIAVDPAFKLSARSRRLADAKARATHYFETTGDTFFANETAFLAQHGIDVALIDGLHSYRQVVRDVENTLRYLRDDGVIVLHDCNPANASIACPVASYADFRA